MKSQKREKVVSEKCVQCAGKCYNENPTKRQDNSLKMFGVIPNACVDSRTDGCRCPFKPQ